MPNTGQRKVVRIHPEIVEPIAVSAAVDAPWFENPGVNAMLGFLMEADELACRAINAVKTFFEVEKGAKIHGRF